MYDEEMSMLIGDGNELGEFLLNRRSKLTPGMAGIPSYGRQRRVPGLRREELAQLAGVSVAYYTRLEQGHSRNASDGVLNALANALQLDDAERAHLLDLARVPERRSRRRVSHEHPHPRTLELLDSIPHLPAVLLGRRSDVLAWNPLGHALLGSHLDIQAPNDVDRRPSMSRMLFLDPHTRDLEADWESYAKIHVGYLRLVSGRYPGDSKLAELIGELTIQSKAFSSLWASGRVRECTFGTRRLRHPLVGELTVTYQVWLQPDNPDYRLEIFTTEPGTASADALALLNTATCGSSGRERPKRTKNRNGNANPGSGGPDTSSSARISSV
jgi:transcriptional regulator with XRE-family HTH domain